jgi:CheY-like chemotaxis protein
LNILVAEDDKDIALSYKLALEQHNHVVFISYNGTDCITQYRKEYQSVKGKVVSGRNQSAEGMNQDSKHKSDIAIDNGLDDIPSPFDAVVLDYQMPDKNGMEVAKEILQINPHQRIIFASAYVIETLKDAVRELNRVVELLQKPFSMEAFVSTIEDNEAYEGLKMLMANLRDIERKQRRKRKDTQKYSPSEDQIKLLFEGLRKIQKHRTF